MQIMPRSPAASSSRGSSTCARWRAGTCHIRYSDRLYYSCCYSLLFHTYIYIYIYIHTHTSLSLSVSLSLSIYIYIYRERERERERDRERERVISPKCPGPAPREARGAPGDRCWLVSAIWKSKCNTSTWIITHIKHIYIYIYIYWTYLSQSPNAIIIVEHNLDMFIQARGAPGGAAECIKIMQIAHLWVKIDSASARSRAIGFYIYSVCFFHMFEPVILILDH